MSSKWSPIIALIGVACLGLGIYSVTKSSPANQQSIGKHISIPFMSYSGAQWDGYGPGYNGANINNAVQLWGSKKGFVMYRFSLSEMPNEAVITTRLSSELNKVKSTNPFDSSDVTLVVNGTSQDTKTVIPDNGDGEEYAWTIPASVLRPGSNEIRLQVGSGQSNGLCIYSPIEISLR